MRKRKRRMLPLNAEAFETVQVSESEGMAVLPVQPCFCMCSGRYYQRFNYLNRLWTDYQ